MEYLKDNLFIIFLAGFGVASILSIIIFSRYITFIEKIQNMFVEFKNEGNKTKWLK